MPHETTLDRQLGDVLGGLQQLSASIESRHVDTEKMHVLLRQDLSVLRQDQRDLEEKLDCVVCVVQHELDGLRENAGRHAQSVSDLVVAVGELRRPLAEIAALRSRVGGAIVCLGMIGSIVLWLAEPIYRWIVEQYLKR